MHVPWLLSLCLLPLFFFYASNGSFLPLVLSHAHHELHERLPSLTRTRTTSHLQMSLSLDQARREIVSIQKPGVSASK